MTNRKLKSAESLYYKNLIEPGVNPKEMWKSLNCARKLSIVAKGAWKKYEAVFLVNSGHGT